MMEFVLILLLIINTSLLTVLLFKKNKTDTSGLEALLRSVKEEVKDIGELQSKIIKTEFEGSEKRDREMKEALLDTIKANERHLVSTLNLYSEKLGEIKDTLEKRVKAMEDSNSKKLEEMRQVVDEKLQKTLNDRISQSFKEVSDRLAEVYKGLGEMQTIATSVGDLKKTLSNVKARGILGEIQLGAILQDMLTPDQYAVNVPTVEGSRDPVEFAIKLPGGDNGEFVYLPIDSKFPLDAYNDLNDAYDTGDQEAIAAARNVLITRIKKFADDVKKKYVSPPRTTDFAIMFLPTEGLYAEVVRLGMIETLQEKYKITIAGPTTMAALLNSLQMGFKTLAIQKRSSEVWDTLAHVKNEFGKFEDVLTKAQNKLNQANRDLEELVGTRTKQINRRLRDVATLPESEEGFFELSDGSES
ncbi:MAG: DNA recombination protein RmuC [Clostridia bacterium]|nr:DNA recombination protein RmuC [Clostridia bacterium]